MKNTFRTITLGDARHSVVKRIQIRLNLMGGSPVAEDGDFGLKTLQAVREFQLSHHDKNGNPLVADGKVGPRTWASLFEVPVSGNRQTLPLLTELLEVARKEIGIKEDPPGSNRGPRIGEYLKSVGLGPGYAWCAAFVYWCFKQAAMNLNCENPVLKTASCMKHWQKTTGVKITVEEAIQNPGLIEPGDIFIIRRRGGKGHTGIVTGYANGYIQTIEGNSNSSHSAEGDGVVSLQRKIDTISAGFIKYKLTTEKSSTEKLSTDKTR